MEILFDEENKKEYSAKKFSIAVTFGGRRKQFISQNKSAGKMTKKDLIQLIKVAKENNWTALDLSDCGIEHIPDELWEVTSLKVLYLGNYSEDEEEKNRYLEISEKIANLENLEALSICNVENVCIPDVVKTMPHLVYLDCFGCEYKSIPENLLNSNLRGIGIDCANPVQLKRICKLKKMVELYLTGADIVELPNEIRNLRNLKRLCIRGTKISKIPESMIELKKLKYFEIEGTPLFDSIPKEMIKQTAQELIAYICKQQNESVPYYFNESKMIVVGQGNVGKSCLVERITSNVYQEKDSTEGIDVKKWEYTIGGKSYVLNIWDFGGQEIYHSTHQFFLTKRSLYVFVWDARAEEEYGRIDYGEIRCM